MKEIKEKLAAAKAACHAAADAPPSEARKLHAEVKRLQAEMAKAITKGAKPCPKCGEAPHGMEQPRHGGRGVEYEIGCLGCRDDAKGPRPRVRGGMIPKHAVEAWNAEAWS